MNAKKETKLMQLTRANLREMRQSVRLVTAGQLAEHMGISRTTAKKYLEMNVRAGYLMPYEFTHVNGQTAIAYIAVKGGK